MTELPVDSADMLLNEKLIDLLPIGVVVLDRQGRVVRYNRYEQLLAQRRPQDVLGHLFFEEVAVCTRIPEIEGAWRSQIATNQLDAVVEHVFRLPFLPAPREVRIRLRSFSVHDELYGVLLIEDISEQRQMQQDRDRLLSIMMHDLNQPLTGVLGYGEILANGAFEAGEMKSIARLIVNSAQQMTDLIRDQQAELSRRRKATLRPVNLHAIILSVLSLYLTQARERGVRISYEGPLDSVRFPDKAIPIFSDEQKLPSVVSNLVSNAVKYARSSVSLEVTQLETQVALKVCDDGPGIADAERERIFDERYQSPDSKPGQGLGLFSVRQSLSGMQGTVRVVDQPTGGTCFLVVLPAAPPG